MDSEDRENVKQQAKDVLAPIDVIDFLQMIKNRVEQWKRELTNGN